MKTRLSPFLLIIAVYYTAANTCQAANDPIRLWPGTAPGDTNNFPAEADTAKPGEGWIAGRPIIRLGNVSQPSLTLFKAPRKKDSRPMVVVFPGGGYNILAWDLEGTEVAKWFNSIGVTAAVLKYRVPGRAGRPRYEPGLQDAQRALGIARSRAGEWGVDPARIGVLGFSAGGHLAAMLSNNYEKRTYDSFDAADTVSCRPDFAMLIYPGALTAKADLTQLAPELHVSSNAPPSFLVQSEDDSAKVECSLVYYRALKDAKVPAEMHLFATGGHGYGLRPTVEPITGWPKYAEAWLRQRGLLEPKK